jgi:hypothetical protein
VDVAAGSAGRRVDARIVVRVRIAGIPNRPPVSLWEVSDRTTPVLMTEFYWRVREGRSPSDAVPEAKIERIRSCRPVRRHPHCGAPCAIFGAL